MARIWLLVLSANLILAVSAQARPVFLADGGVIEAQSVWRNNGMIEVLVNRESLVRFSPEQVDLEKTFDKKWDRPKVKTVKSSPSPAASKPTEPVIAAGPAVVVPDPVPAVPPSPARVESSPSNSSVSSRPASPPAENPRPAEPLRTVEKPPAPRPTAMKPPAAAPLPPPLEFSMEGDPLAALLPLAAVLAITLLLLASFWKIFEKAGEAGWKSLIPIYNGIVLLRIAGCPLWWILLFFVPVVNLLVLILMHIRLAKQFGQGPVYGLALCFFGFIFFPLLAFGKATYGGHGDDGGGRRRGEEDFDFATF